jgi:hypothetical protein
MADDLNSTGGLRAQSPRGGTDRVGEDGRAPTTASAEAGASEGSGAEGRPGRSGPGGNGSGPDAGSPGGMGGVRASGGTGTDRPPGGLSPMSHDRTEDEGDKG